jgi:hypothetical protein
MRRCVGTFVRLVPLLRGRVVKKHLELRVLLLSSGRDSNFERQCAVLLGNGEQDLVSIRMDQGINGT